ncbi:hypothetical protein [Clostridium folliculivorans]|uniref:Uncharacterized protein n=1 Tax=Clostridium folliculivorans TaxID=2886038 RepID=A0A9W5XZZ0_9CLOT|nr:hypothetical protein [Clostridium folliculivorans]GKU24012.1 hypothetical protein CFOLD11_08380 [Clostridium folliculivorans]GKU30127.1 hypothetical protein CFB3_22340 [Clostridium folliculivorans]
MKGLNEVKKSGFSKNSFSDAAIRSSANTEEYVSYVISLINSNLFKGEDTVDYLLDEESLCLYHGQNEFLNISQKYVDNFRQRGNFAFDKFILDILSANGFDINKRNNYYNKLKRVCM